MKKHYIPQEQRKKILILSDDIRTTSGIATMAREIVLGTCHHYNWVNLGATIQHPDEGKKLETLIDPINVEIEKLGREEQELYRQIVEHHPELTEDQIVNFVRDRLLKEGLS
jgi:hypothetical protein